MDVHYSTTSEPATPDYVLSVIRADYSQLCCLGDAYSGEELSFDTSVDDWQDAADLLPWRELGWALNERWDIDCSDSEWQNVLTPARQKRLSDVCALIASRATRPRIQPARLFGKGCQEAGAFLTIRSLLADAGAPVANLRPSTSLGPYTRRYFETFLVEISRLAPGAMPGVKYSHPAYEAACWAMMFGWLSFVIGWLAGLPLVSIAGGAIAIISYAMVWFTARCCLPRSVQFGSLETFRDLAVAVSAHNGTE